MRTRARLLAATALLALAGGAAGCGSSAPSSTSTADAPSGAVVTSAARPTPPASPGRPVGSPRTTVARIGRVKITLGTLQRQVRRETHGQFGTPEPPDYTGCIESTTAGAAGVTAAEREQAKRACEQEYGELSRTALSTLIHTQWLVEQARDEGLPAQATQASADPLRLGERLSRELAGKLERETPSVGRAQAAAYYARRRGSFVAAERRDLYVARFADLAAAQKAKREIEHGASFATIVAHDSLQQPIGAHRGFVRGLTAENWPEQPLSSDVFHAPVRKLEGPVQITLGFYVFEVVHTAPRRARTFAEVEAEVLAKLRASSHDRTVARFVAAFLRKWKPRTSCRAGYVVRWCREHKPSGNEPLEASAVL